MNPISAENQILTEKQILKKIKRMAFELYEQNFEEESLILAGVEGTGYTLAEMLFTQLQLVSPLHLGLIEISLDKSTPSQADIILSGDIKDFQNKVVVVVDDVLNTGRTLAYSLKPFLKQRILKLQVAVLVDRNHRKFPISPDVVGYELSTTVHEHVEVTLDGELSVSLT